MRVGEVAFEQMCRGLVDDLRLGLGPHLGALDEAVGRTVRLTHDGRFLRDNRAKGVVERRGWRLSIPSREIHRDRPTRFDNGSGHIRSKPDPVRGSATGEEQPGCGVVPRLVEANQPLVRIHPEEHVGMLVEQRDLVFGCASDLPLGHVVMMGHRGRHAGAAAGTVAVRHDDAVPTWIWLDGRLVDAHAPHLSVSDRGFQLGDGIFETARARRGVVIELDEHLERLRESVAALDIELPFDDDRLVAAIAELLAAEGLDGRGADAGDAAFAGVEPGDAPDAGHRAQPGYAAAPTFAGHRAQPGDAAVRITVSRGPTDSRGLLPPGLASVRATVAIQAWPHVPPADDLLRRGVRVIASAIRRDPGSPLAGIKSTSRADYVYAKLEAARAGADDALLLTTDGAISEATAANIFVVAGATLGTPPATAGILVGTTRSWLLRHASALGLEVAEVELRPAHLLAADEAFLTSSVAGIMPLTAYDGRPIGGGRPGQRTLALRQAREEWIEAMSLAAFVEEPAP